MRLPCWGEGRRRGEGAGGDEIAGELGKAGVAGLGGEHAGLRSSVGADEQGEFQVFILFTGFNGEVGLVGYFLFLLSFPKL